MAFDVLAVDAVRGGKALRTLVGVVEIPGANMTGLRKLAKLPDQLNHASNQTILIRAAPQDMPLCGAMLPQKPTGPAFGCIKLPSNVIDTSATANGAQKFP